MKHDLTEKAPSHCPLPQFVYDRTALSYDAKIRKQTGGEGTSTTKRATLKPEGEDSAKNPTLRVGIKIEINTQRGTACVPLALHTPYGAARTSSGILGCTMITSGSEFLPATPYWRHSVRCFSRPQK